MRTTAVARPPFRFDKVAHRYSVDGREIPHITSMLMDAGYVDDLWMTEEGRDRGSAVHGLCTDYDLGAISDPSTVEPDEYKGYFLAYVEAMRRIKPTWTHVEIAMVHPTQRWGGRPDRCGVVWGARAVLEIKTGQRHPATGIQLALQAMLVAREWSLPPEAILRYELRLKANGKAVLDEHTDKGDFGKARAVIRACCR